MRYFLIIPFIALLLLISYTYFIGIRIFSDHNAIVLLFTLLLFITMFGWELGYRFNGSLANERWFCSLAWIGSTLLGIWASFVLFVIIIDVGLFIFSVITNLFCDSSLMSISNIVLFKWSSVIAFVASVLIAGFGLKMALSGPKVVSVKIPVESHLESLKKLKLVQLSDLHVGVLINKDYVEKVVRKVNELKPDIIVFTGDVADGLPINLKDELQPLSKLSAPFGKFYVTGNHEYYWDAAKWVDCMNELDFIPLMNENRIINFLKTKILMAGITDISAEKFLPAHKSDLLKASISNESVDYKIILSHNPRVIKKAQKAGFNLLLAGHTHAGQFFPFSLLITLAHKYHTGLNRYDKTWVYINSGTGSWGPINRFGIHSEITVITFS